MTPAQEGLSPVEKLDATHDVDSFACGKEPLDRFLKRFALANQKADSARTYVACRGLTVLAKFPCADTSLPTYLLYYLAYTRRVSLHRQLSPYSLFRFP